MCKLCGLYLLTVPSSENGPTVLYTSLCRNQVGFTTVGPNAVNAWIWQYVVNKQEELILIPGCRVVMGLRHCTT